MWGNKTGCVVIKCTVCFSVITIIVSVEARQKVKSVNSFPCLISLQQDFFEFSSVFLLWDGLNCRKSFRKIPSFGGKIIFFVCFLVFEIRFGNK